MSKNYEGIIPPIITPFDKNGMIDEKLAAKEMKIGYTIGFP